MACFKLVLSQVRMNFDQVTFPAKAKICNFWDRLPLRLLNAKKNVKNDFLKL